jgi:hypothetical protein
MKYIIQNTTHENKTDPGGEDTDAEVNKNMNDGKEKK